MPDLKRNLKPKYAKVARSKDWRKLYNSIEWKKTRNWYISTHPFCEDCLQLGKARVAVEVHHIHPFRSGLTKEKQLDLLLDENNLVSLCKECHVLRHDKVLKNLKENEEYLN
jgi:5-methylcytosine-specific restriction enzyme A